MPRTLSASSAIWLCVTAIQLLHSTGHMLRRVRPTAARSFCLVLAAGVLLLAGACQGLSGRPNVILISIDTLRADRLNGYGFRGREVSPHIDALADDGILFHKFITTSPWTTPAHMSLFTSLNPGVHGITASFRDLRKDLSSGGHFITLSRSVETLTELLAAADMRTAAFTAGGTVDPKIGFGRGFELYDTSMLKLGRHNTSTIAEWLRRNTEEPFFLFLHTFEVHAPYLRTRFLDEVLPADRATPLKRAIDALRRTITTVDPMEPGFRQAQLDLVGLLREHQAYDAEVCEALYLGGVHHADEWVGSLVGDLKRLGLYDKTLVILTSDHGEEFADRAPGRFYNRHGHTLYEEMIRVPLIIKLPDQQHAGVRLRRLARMIDVMPTVLDMVGIERKPLNMQGVSLRPLWEDGGANAPRFAITEALSARAEKKSIRTDRYKLVVWIDPKTVEALGRGPIPAQPERLELFDLESDPRERNNLLADPVLPTSLGVARKLEAQLRAAVGQRHAQPEETTLDPETIERLRGLGYVED